MSSPVYHILESPTFQEPSWVLVNTLSQPPPQKNRHQVSRRRAMGVGSMMLFLHETAPVSGWPGRGERLFCAGGFFGEGLGARNSVLMPEWVPARKTVIVVPTRLLRNPASPVIDKRRAGASTYSLRDERMNSLRAEVGGACCSPVPRRHGGVC